MATFKEQARDWISVFDRSEMFNMGGSLALKIWIKIIKKQNLGLIFHNFITSIIGKFYFISWFKTQFLVMRVKSDISHYLCDVTPQNLSFLFVYFFFNQITGNLVRSKLRVAEQYVHILPMNTEVSVEGVRVILLDANQ